MYHRRKKYIEYMTTLFYYYWMFTWDSEGSSGEEKGTWKYLSEMKKGLEIEEGEYLRYINCIIRAIIYVCLFCLLFIMFYTTTRSLPFSFAVSLPRFRKLIFDIPVSCIIFQRISTEEFNLTYRKSEGEQMKNKKLSSSVHQKFSSHTKIHWERSHFFSSAERLETEESRLSSERENGNKIFHLIACVLRDLLCFDEMLFVHTANLHITFFFLNSSLLLHFHSQLYPIQWRRRENSRIWFFCF